MSIVTNPQPSTPVSINTIILLSYKRAGLLPVEATIAGANMVPKLEHGRQLLDVILDSLATQGFIARTQTFYDLPMVAGEPHYTLPDSILDVHGDAMFVPDHNPDTKHTTGELVCKQIDLATWQSLTTKGSTSTRPQLYAALRQGATVELRFWPVPSDAGVMRLTVARLLGSNADGTKNPDLQRYWYDAVIWCLAYYLAVDSASVPVERCAMLKAVADEKKAACLSYGFEHTDKVAMVVHDTGWC